MGKQCQTLFLWGTKITADGECSLEIKRRLLLGRRVMTNLDSILKSRDITLPRYGFFQWLCMDVRVGQRDGMGREMGGGFRMGNTCTPVADAC